MNWFGILKLDIDDFIDRETEENWYKGLSFNIPIRHNGNNEYPPRVAMRWLLETIEKYDYVNVDENDIVIIKPSWAINQNLSITEGMYIDNFEDMVKGESFSHKDLIDANSLKNLFTIEYFSFWLKHLYYYPYTNIQLKITFKGIKSNRLYSSTICILDKNVFPTADSYVNLIVLLNNKELFLSLW